MASPIIKKSIIPTMTFPDAMAKVIEGKKVSRLEWNDQLEYGYLKDGLLLIRTQDVDKQGKAMYNDHKWMVSDGDMLNNDWIVVTEEVLGNQPTEPVEMKKEIPVGAKAN